MHEDQNTAFGALRMITKAATAACGFEPMLPRLQVISKRAVILGNSQFVSLDMIMDAVKKLLKYTKAYLEQDVLLGMNCSSFYLRCRKGFVDDLQSTRVHYSFLRDPKNNLQEFEELFTKYLLKSPKLRSHFVRSSTNATVEWNRSNLYAWLKKAHHLSLCVSVLLHISYGLPARAEELAAILQSNSQHQYRSLFWMMDMLVVITYYHKGRSSSGHDKAIPRFVPQEVAELLLATLVLIRPFEM